MGSMFASAQNIEDLQPAAPEVLALCLSARELLIEISKNEQNQINQLEEVQKYRETIVSGNDYLSIIRNIRYGDDAVYESALIKASQILASNYPLRHSILKELADKVQVTHVDPKIGNFGSLIMTKACEYNYPIMQYYKNNYCFDINDRANKYTKSEVNIYDTTIDGYIEVFRAPIIHETTIEPKNLTESQWKAQSVRVEQLYKEFARDNKQVPSGCGKVTSAERAADRSSDAYRKAYDRLLTDPVRGPLFKQEFEERRKELYKLA
jgi:hypothetical protein